MYNNLTKRRIAIGTIILLLSSNAFQITSAMTERYLIIDYNSEIPNSTRTTLLFGVIKDMNDIGDEISFQPRFGITLHFCRSNNTTGFSYYGWKPASNYIYLQYDTKNGIVTNHFIWAVFFKDLGKLS